MDGTTEPIIAVIGHPIAGNPSQFAVERALHEMKLEWRVLSFDVAPDDIAAALEGFSVTGIAGVLIDPSVEAAASRWYAEKTSDPDVVIDCLFRDQDSNLVGSYEQLAWVDDRIAQHAGERRIWLGDSLQHSPISRDGFAEQPVSVPPEPDLIARADLIVIAHGASEPTCLEAEDWPEDDGSTLVIDLTLGHPEQPLIRQLGYVVAGNLERQIGTLQRCLARWTGNKASAEVIYDAIEEYLGV